MSTYARDLTGRRLLAVLAFSSAMTLPGCGQTPELASVSAPVSPPPATLFRDVSLFDGITLRHHQDVLVVGPEVAQVADAGQGVWDLPRGTEVVGGAGRTLLPGLIDSHTHLVSAGEKHPPAPAADAIAEAFLYAGVTTILVTAGFDEVTSFREAQDDGSVLGPTLFWGGPGLTAPGGHPIPLLEAMLPWPIDWMVTRSVVTAADGPEASERVKEIVETHHPDFIKITYDDLPPGSAHLSRAALEGAVSASQAAGRRAIVHTTTPEDTMQAVEAGAGLLAHVPQRGRLSEEEAERLAASGVPVITTVRLPSASYELAAEGPMELEREMLPPSILQPWMDNPQWELAGFSEEIDRHHTDVAADTEANFRKLLDAGVRLLVGTDSGVHGIFPGASLHREMRLLVRLGMSAADVLRAATSEPGRVLDPEGHLGRVAPGARADLLLVRGDPLADITALADIEAVFLGGVRLERHPQP